ncbi:MAG: hypothetical protein MZV63_56480 [Marinilabiliales bacterium]|nr:hypothetical protein [Marinilabiliales bacterium]
MRRAGPAGRFRPRRGCGRPSAAARGWGFALRGGVAVAPFVLGQEQVVGAPFGGDAVLAADPLAARPWRPRRGCRGRGRCGA